MAKSRIRTKAANKGAASLLGRLSTKPTASAKSTTPQIAVSDEVQLTAIAEIIDAKNAVKQADSALKVAEGAFRTDAIDLFEDRCRKDGTYHTSVRMVGKLIQDGQDSRPLSLQLVATRKCGKMLETDASDPLHSAFGTDFDALFAPQRTVEIDTSKLTDEQIEKLVETMQDALGDSFEDAVSVNALIVAKEAFYGRRILDSKIRVKADNAAADGYAKTTTPYFKL